MGRWLHLFDEIRRTDPRPAGYSEGSFAFLNRVDDPHFAAVRQLMENWFSHYPDAHRDDLCVKFRDKDERNVASAFWELFLHELHRRLGFEITVHPSVPGTARRPDFRFANAEHAFYLEAAVVAHSDKEMASRQLEAIVLDIINQAHSPDFSLSVDWKHVGRTMPRRQEVVGKVEAWLATLDWEAEREKLATRSWNDPRRLPAATTVIEFGDWAASLTAFPRRTRGGDADRKTIGSPPGLGGYGDDITPVRDTLKFKASRYGRPDLPYVIAVGLLLDFAQFEDLEQALYGRETLRVIWPFGDKQPEMLPSREPHGLWQHGKQQRGTRVSAVLSVRAPSPYGLTEVEPSVWINPWASRPLGYKYPFATVTADVSANHIRRAPEMRAVHDISGLARDWPGIAPFAARHARLRARSQ